MWLSDGLQEDSSLGGTDRLTERLRRFDGLQVVLPDAATTPILLLPPSAEGRDLIIAVAGCVAFKFGLTGAFIDGSLVYLTAAAAGQFVRGGSRAMELRRLIRCSALEQQRRGLLEVWRRLQKR